LPPFVVGTHRERHLVRGNAANALGDLGVTELRRLKMLEGENARLKRIVADLTLDKQILQEVVRKKL
jgi:hypothetical protein